MPFIRNGDDKFDSFRLIFYIPEIENDIIHNSN